MKKTLMLAGLLSGIVFTPADAAQTPKSAGYDSRVQYVNHNPDNVVHIRTKVGVATLIQLQEGETVLKDVDGTSGLGMGFGYGVRQGMRVEYPWEQFVFKANGTEPRYQFAFYDQ